MRIPFKTRRGLDPMLTMINVVFLLLAFFMLGNFDEPNPTTLELPLASGEDAPSMDRLILDENGKARFQGAMNEDAIEAAKQAEDIIISADARLDANTVIRITNQLRIAGVRIQGVEVAE